MRIMFKLIVLLEYSYFCLLVFRLIRKIYTWWIWTSTCGKQGRVPDFTDFSQISLDFRDFGWNLPDVMDFGWNPHQNSPWNLHQNPHWNPYQNLSTIVFFPFNYSIFTTEMDGEFSLVMITEYFPESLVMLRRTMCWGIGDVLFTSINMRLYLQKGQPFHPKLIEMHRKWNLGRILFTLQRWSLQWEGMELGSICKSVFIPKGPLPLTMEKIINSHYKNFNSLILSFHTRNIPKSCTSLIFTTCKSESWISHGEQVRDLFTSLNIKITTYNHLLNFNIKLLNNYLNFLINIYAFGYSFKAIFYSSNNFWLWSNLEPEITLKNLLDR